MGDRARSAFLARERRRDRPETERRPGGHRGIPRHALLAYVEAVGDRNPEWVCDDLSLTPWAIIKALERMGRSDLATPYRKIRNRLYEHRRTLRNRLELVMDDYTRRGHEIERLTRELAEATQRERSAIALQRADFEAYKKQEIAASVREREAEAALWAVLSRTERIPRARHDDGCWTIHAGCLAEKLRRHGGPVGMLSHLRSNG